jgi:hypothetical protein
MSLWDEYGASSDDKRINTIHVNKEAIKDLLVSDLLFARSLMIS